MIKSEMQNSNKRPVLLKCEVICDNKYKRVHVIVTGILCMT